MKGYHVAQTHEVECTKVVMPHVEVSYCTKELTESFCES